MMGVNPYIQGTYEPTVVVKRDPEKDAFIVEKTDELGVKTSRTIPRYEVGYTDPRRFAADVFNGAYMMAGTADNDINRVYGSSAFMAQNAYKPPRVFPRSEQEMDAIMIRRVNARLRLQQEKHWRHLRIAGIALAVGWLFPVLCAVIARTWYSALAWIAS